MPTVSPIPVNPAVLTWARVESGYAVDRVAERLQVKSDRVQAWESGARPPTLRQVRELSRFYHRPLSVFFLAAPPQVPPPAAEYRRLPGVVPGREANLAMIVFDPHFPAFNLTLNHQPGGPL